jgi:hypothetical protein
MVRTLKPTIPDYRLNVKRYFDLSLKFGLIAAAAHEAGGQVWREFEKVLKYGRLATNFVPV